MDGGNCWQRTDAVPAREAECPRFVVQRMSCSFPECGVSKVMAVKILLNGEHSLIFRSHNWPCMRSVREQVHVNTLRLGGPDDGVRSRPFARGVS